MAVIEDLIVSEYGSFVGLRGKRLQVKVKGELLVEAPLLHLRSVQVQTRSASISAAALAGCCENGIPVHFTDAVDGNYATVLSPYLTTVVTTRRHQITAVNNGIGLEIAAQLGIGKIRSQAANLRYLARRQPEDVAHDLKNLSLDLNSYIERIEIIQDTTLDEVRAALMGIEGHCARLYWQAVGTLIPEHYEWPGRLGRHATDPVNCLLNYGYGILYGEVQNALVIAGLEPYVGIVHTDRPGKPSMTLDLIEEFRAPIVDRTVVGLLNRNFSVCVDENGRLDRATRQSYAEHILSRLNAQGSYHKKRYSLRSIIQMQARQLAAALRGEIAYESYIGG